MGEIRFDGRVAIVTGAGHRSGPVSHVLGSGSERGAKVVVNDLGVSAWMGQRRILCRLRILSSPKSEAMPVVKPCPMARM